MTYFKSNCIFGFFLNYYNQNIINKQYLKTQLLPSKMHKNLLIFVSWFCTLPLCWKCQLHLDVFWWNFWGLIYNIILPAIRDNSILFTIIPLISFSCTIVPTCASCTTLLKNRDGGQSCLIPHFNGVVSSFYQFRIMLAVCLSYSLYFIKIVFPPSHSLYHFYHKSMLDLVKCFFCISWDADVILISKSTYMIYYFHWITC